MDDRPRAIFLLGPTAAGKTALAVEIAARLPCTIISVDSAMVYRGLNIGTAKPDTETLARYPHRLIDIRDPADAYSAAQFRTDALGEMAEAVACGRTPLLVGGTGLYFRALEYGLSPLPQADAGKRAELTEEARRIGWAALHQQLLALDPPSGRRIHAHDAQRIQRALEVYKLTGKTLSELYADTCTQSLPYRVLKFIIMPERDSLHARIAQRLDSMLEQGFVQEVATLHARGDLNLNMPALRAVGYRQIWHYLDGHIPYATMRDNAVTATRQLAKRQLTWLRRENGAITLTSENAAVILRTLQCQETSL